GGKGSPPRDAAPAQDTKVSPARAMVEKRYCWIAQGDPPVSPSVVRINDVPPVDRLYPANLRETTSPIELCLTGHLEWRVAFGNELGVDLEVSGTASDANLRSVEVGENGSETVRLELQVAIELGNNLKRIITQVH